MSKLFSFFLALAVAAPLASAQPGKYQYTELKPPQPTEVQGKQVEVVEFFWYGCPHCYNLEPLIEAWTKKLPPDVQFRRIPAVFNPRWLTLQFQIGSPVFTLIACMAPSLPPEKKVRTPFTSVMNGFA